MTLLIITVWNEYSLSHYKVPLYTPYIYIYIYTHTTDPSYDHSWISLIISRLFIFVKSKLTIYFHNSLLDMTW